VKTDRRRCCRSAAAALALASGCALGATSAQAALPDFGTVRGAHEPSDFELLDRHGEPVQVLRADRSVRRGPWLGLAELSPALRAAIVIGEDRRFWEHGGVDWRALAASAWANAWNTRTRGASTVTMQLAGLLDDAAARPPEGRGLPHKLQQMRLARELELRWTKVQILEAYLNLVPFRGELVGVAAASVQLFGKHASGLDAAEAALLAALVRAPNAAAGAVSHRACELLRQQHLGCEGLATLAEQSFARKPGAMPGAQLAPHFARHWFAASGKRRGSRSTLDASLQRLALSALRQQLAELRGREVEDGAVIVLDNASGDVLAWVGSAGPSSGAAQVDAVSARRQSGSAIKPFVYALAFERGLIAPGSLLHDAPLQLAAGAAVYQPGNFDAQFRGWVSAREALGGSLNVPAVRVAAMLGPEPLFEGLNRIGLGLRESGGYHGHALGLGSAETTLVDLTNAYRALANGGIAGPVRLRRDAPAAAPRRVLGAAAAREVAAVLADPGARAASFGFDSPLVTRAGAAVKTGTSKDMRDNWCIGFTRRYTVGVWVGNASGAPMHGVSGVVGAAPVWRRIVEALADEAPAVAPRAAAPERRAGAAAFRIGPVTEGSVYAIDPEAPPARQQLRLAGPKGDWFVDGKAMGRGESLRWALAPGRHRVEVRSADGRLLDRVNFEVRWGARPVAIRRFLRPRSG
jgi:penicillin-binding protein 1C